MKLTHPLTVLDLETTGTWIEKDKIIEVALIRCEPNGEETRYEHRFNPQIQIPAIVSEITGISNEDVKDKPVFADKVDEILEFIGDSHFAGFNLERFDLPLLAREVNEAGRQFQWKHRKIYDAQKVFHINEKRDLTAAYKFYCEKDLENAHSAMADTQATLEILKKQVEVYGENDQFISTLDRFNYAVRDEFYDEERRFRWWNGKLYIMFGKYAKTHSLQDLVKEDKGYLNWILSADFSDEVKELIRNAMNGNFPIKEEFQANQT